MELLRSKLLGPSSTEDEVFEHQPLDHTKPSIRLVRILPFLSSTGLVQCTVSHHDIHALYTCLSYCWGSPTHSHRILLDGKVFWVRKNLFDFLTVVQKALGGETSASYWIDAISIDQDNISERNHQVAQMSQIFSGAKYVHLWLGSMPNLRDVLPFFMDAEVGNNPGAWKVVPSYSHTISHCITHNEYWGRAWVVQELALARLVLVILQEDTIALPHLLMGLKNLYLGGGNRFFTQFTAMIDGNSPERKDIMSLISHFREQSCSVPRDRVFSLLSLCDEGPQQFLVDYAESSINIAFDILSKSCLLPCLCSITTLLHVLRLHEEKEPEASVTEHDTVGPYVEFDCTGFDIRGRYSDFLNKNSGLWTKRLSRFNVEWRDDACRGRHSDDVNKQWGAPALVFDGDVMIENLGQSAGVTVSVGELGYRAKLSATITSANITDERTKYIRASGLTARRRDDYKNIFTVRVAFWALASWDEAVDPSPNELCRRAKTLKSDVDKYVEKKASGLWGFQFTLGLRIGYGSWDLKAAEADK